MELVRQAGAGSVRANWLDRVIRELQCASAASLAADRSGAFEVIAACAESIPEADTSLERLLLKSLLFEFGWHFGRTFHSQFHRSAHVCPFSPPSVIEHAWKDDGDRPTTLLARWARHFFREFAKTHPLTTSERAVRLLRTDYRSACQLRDVARALSVTPSHLDRDFHWHHGISLKEYQHTLRIIEALEQLRGEKIEAIALQVGFRSRKDFNRVFEQLTRMTPTQFKRLSEGQAADVLESTRVRLYLRGERRTSQGSQS